MATVVNKHNMVQDTQGLEHLPTPIVIASPDGHILWANHALDELHPFASASSNWFGLVALHDRLRAKQAFTQAFRSRVAQKIVLAISHEGTEKSIEWRLSRWRGPDATEEQLLCIGHDISSYVHPPGGKGLHTQAQVAASGQLQQGTHDALLYNTVQNLPLALVLAGPERHIILLNSKTQEIFGYAPDVLLGQTTEILYPSREDFLLQGQLRFNIHTQTPSSNYFSHYRRASGEIFPASTIGHAIRNDEGEVMGYMGLIEDLSQNHAHLLLTRAEAIVRALPDEVFELDAQGRFLNYRRHPEMLVGLPLDQTQERGQRLEDILPDAVTRKLRDAIHEAASSGTVTRVEFTHHDRAYEWRLCPTPERTLVVVARDVSRERRLTQDLRTQAQHLRDANSLLQQFTYITSHDLRTPLRGIKNLALWLQEELGDDLSAGGQRDFDLLIERVERMQDLITALYRFVKVGNADTAYELLVLDTFLAELAQQHTQDDPNVTIHVHCQTQPCFIRRGPLSHILNNLISNAIHHHDQTHKTISIHISDTPDDEMQIDVDDDGPGIPHRYQERIWQVFRSVT
ncbi:MAG: PAS domain-containing protein, partial [Myxococcota bacterium]